MFYTGISNVIFTLASWDRPSTACFCPHLLPEQKEHLVFTHLTQRHLHPLSFDSPPENSLMMIFLLSLLLVLLRPDQDVKVKLWKQEQNGNGHDM